MPAEVKSFSPSWDDLSGCLHRKNEGFLDKVDLYGRRFSLFLETGKFYTTNRVIEFVESKLIKESNNQVRLQIYKRAKNTFTSDGIALSKKQQQRVDDVLNLGEAIASSLSAQAPTPTAQSPIDPRFEELDPLLARTHAPKNESVATRRSILIRRGDLPVEDGIKQLKESLLDLRRELEEYDEKIAPPEEGVDLKDSIILQELKDSDLLDAALVQANNVKAFQKDKKETQLSESFLSESLLKQFEEEAKAQEKFMAQLKLTVEYENSLAKDFDIQRVPPDGNCFFYSLAHQVKEGVTKENLSQRMKEVRREVTDYMRANAETYQMLSGLEGRDFDNYLKGMRDGGSWGTGLEAYAASNLYGRTIRLHVPPTPETPASEGKPARKGDPATIQEMNPDQPVERNLPPVVLLYNGANHWDWLKPKD